MTYIISGAHLGTLEKGLIVICTYAGASNMRKMVIIVNEWPTGARDRQADMLPGRTQISFCLDNIFFLTISFFFDNIFF